MTLDEILEARVAQALRRLLGEPGGTQIGSFLSGGGRLRVGAATQASGLPEQPAVPGEGGCS